MKSVRTPGSSGRYPSSIVHLVTVAASIIVADPRPSRAADVDDAEVAAGDLDQLRGRTGGGRAVDVVAGLGDRDDVVVGGVHAPDRYVERDLLRGIDRGVVRTRGVTEEGLDRPATEAVPRPGDEVEDSCLGDDVGDRHAGSVATGRPGREVAARGVAEGDDPAEALLGQQPAAAIAARWSMPAATSSRVAGTPPPLPTRRYSRFHVTQPRAVRSCASGVPSERSYSAFQKPPWITTTTPWGVPSGTSSSPNWLGSSP